MLLSFLGVPQKKGKNGTHERQAGKEKKQRLQAYYDGNSEVENNWGFHVESCQYRY